MTTATISPEPGHGVEAGPCYSGDLARHEPYPLELQLLGTDCRTYRRMERVAVDVRIKNVSSEAVLLPWSPTPIAERNRPLSGYRHAAFEFVLIDLQRRKFATDLFVLYGSPAIAGSLTRLEPRESITFRMPAMLSGNGAQDERNPILYPAPGLRISTEMWVFAPGEERFRCRFGFSANSLPIRIAPTIAAVPEPRDDGRPPVVRDVAPLPTSADRVVRLAGYRLGADHSDEVDVIFSNGPLSRKRRLTVRRTSRTTDRTVCRSCLSRFLAMCSPVPGTWRSTDMARAAHHSQSRSPTGTRHASTRYHERK